MSSDIGNLIDAIHRLNLSTRDRAAVLDAVRPFVGAAEARFTQYAEPLQTAGLALKELVEGRAGHRWANGSGLRLKDTPEWVAFYNAIGGAA